MRSSIPLRLCTSVAAILAVFSVLWQPRTAGQQPPDTRIPAGVRAAAARGESVRVIVGVQVNGYRPEGELATADAQRAAIAARVGQVLDRLPAAVGQQARRYDFIPFFAAEVDPNTLLQLDADPDVTSIEEDRVAYPLLAQSSSIIGATAAWAAGHTGAGWAVAVLDSGVDKFHPFLAGKVVSEACYSGGAGASLCPGGARSSTDIGSGVNCSGHSDCSHGTHVAGIAAGAGGFSGVGRGASVVAVQVFSRPSTGRLSASWSDLISGLNRVFALRSTLRIAAVNMSIGGTGYTTHCDSSSMKAIIDQLRSVRIASVIASGNDGYYNGISEPACISTAVSVGSTTKADVISSFSNTASFLSLLAPGSSITSSVPGGGYASFNGTSMATPHVAGAWAVLQARTPSASVSQILAALQSTGPSVTHWYSGLSWPRIQVNAAMNALPLPIVTVDTPGAVSLPFDVGGWAIDPLSGSGPGLDAIHVYLYPHGSITPAFAQAATYGISRPDVGGIYGSRFTNSGYRLTVPSVPGGLYQLVVYARSSATGYYEVTKAQAVNVQGPVSRPVIAIDAPAAGASLARSFTISGWAIDTGAPSGTGVDAVHLYAFPNPGSGAPPVVLGAATYGAARSDVGGIYGARFTNSGYSFSAQLTPGAYRVAVYAKSTLTGQFSANTVDITVTPGLPLMTVDTPGQGAALGRSFTVSGWAIDLDATSGSGVDSVHIWAYPSGGAGVFLGAATTGQSRPDVGGAYGQRFANSGYTFTVPDLIPRAYQLVVYAHSTVTKTFNQHRAVDVTVYAVPPSPAMAVDAPAAGATVSPPFTISGWAIDAASSSGPGVNEIHVYAQPQSGGSATFLGFATYGYLRSDIGQIYGSRFTQSGYSFSVGSLAAGSYNLLVYAYSTVAKSFNNGRSVAITVSAPTPVGWTFGQPLPGPKFSAQIVAVNSFVYAAGGHTGTAADSSVYRYDPAANSWAAVASLPVLDSGQAARYGGSAVELNGKLYLIGGWRTSPPLPTSTLQIYEPSTNTWSQGASLTRLSGCSRAGVINGKIYVLTGCDGYSGYRNKLDIYDPATNTWAAGLDAPTAHADGAGGVINGKFYVTGGIDSSEAYTAAMHVFDPTTNAWTTGPSMPNARVVAGSAVADGKLYVIGGQTSGSQPSSDVLMFDPAAGVWKTGASLNAMRTHLGATTIGKTIYAVGGYVSSSAVTTLEILALGGN